jgi:hypothetical protein
MTTTIESSNKNQVRISASFARRLARWVPAVAGATLIVSTFGMSTSALAASSSSYCDTTYCYSTGSGSWQPLPL